jgi:hypothetical protein
VSLYGKGLQSVRTPVTVGANDGPGVAGAVALGVIILGGVMLFRRKPRTGVGPDTRDIAASLRVRGRDPYKYGL